MGNGAALFGRLPAEAPHDKIIGVQSDAEKICGNETELRGTYADNANYGTVYGANDPAVPEFFPEQDGTENGKYTGHVVQSDGVDKV